LSTGSVESGSEGENNTKGSSQNITRKEELESLILNSIYNKILENTGGKI